MRLTEIINRIEGEIQAEYMMDCIAWSDHYRNNQWSNAINRFEDSLTKWARGSITEDFFENEKRHYLETCIGLIKDYKRIKGIGDQDSFLASLSELEPPKETL